MLLFSCSNKQKERAYTISGNIPAEINDAKVYLYVVVEDEMVAIDSTTVENTFFSFNGTVPDSTVIAIVHPGSFDEYPFVGGWNVIIEPGDIVIDSSQHFAMGTPLNDGFNDWMTQIYEIFDTSVNPDDIRDFFASHWNEHSSDFVGTFVLSNMSSYLEFSFVDSLAAQVPDEVRSISLFSDFFKLLDATRVMQPGNPFTDVSLLYVDGTAVSLSDIIGKGDYVLLDFWASWCGPCRQAMPQLQAIAKKHKALKVYGVAVSDELEDTQRSMAELGISWPVLFDQEGVSARTYGINTIPTMILFAPDGIILARDFSVSQLEQLLAENMK